MVVFGFGTLVGQLLVVSFLVVVSPLYPSWPPDIAPPTARVTAPPQAGETWELKGTQDSGLIRFSNKGVGLL